MSNYSKIGINTLCHFLRELNIQLIFILLFHRAKIAKPSDLNESFTKYFYIAKYKTTIFKDIFY